jgi:hypothetical protein
MFEMADVVVNWVSLKDCVGWKTGVEWYDVDLKTE